MANLSASTPPSDEMYLSSIISGAHGEKYQQELAMIIFERATLKDYDFLLGYEMTVADKFDDVTVFNKTKNEWTLIQTKHTDTSKGKPPPLNFKLLFPEDEVTRDKGEFSMFKYLKSYITVSANIQQRKNIVIFTNRDFSEASLKDQSVQATQRQVDHILSFQNDSHKGLIVKGQLITDLINHVNKDFISLRDSIIKLFTEKVMNETVKNFKTAVASVLIKTNTGVKFTPNPPKEAHHMLTSISSIIDIHTAQVPLDVCINLFTGKSRNKTWPIAATEEIVHQFFKDLILSVGQPDDLRGIINQDLCSWMRTWIRPDYFTRLEEPQLEMSTICLEKFFNEKQSQVKKGNDNSFYKKFLQLSDGKDYFFSAKEDLEQQIRNLSQYDVNDARKYYISRQIEYSEPSHITNKCNSGVERDECVRLRINDKKFVDELSGKFEAQSFLFLTAEPGMGKSTLLEFIALDAQRNGNYCVYLFKLNCFHHKLAQLADNITIDNFISVLGTVLSATHFFKLLKFFKSEDSKTKLLLIFDAFDEVAPRNRNKVSEIFQQMLKSKNVKILVSARRTVKTSVEDKFKVEAMNLVPFNDEDQVNFLRQFWEIREKNLSSFRNYVNHLFKIFFSNINRTLSEFTGLPLMLKMLAEVYADHFQEYLRSEKIDLNEFNTINLYEYFVGKCFGSVIIKKFSSFDPVIDKDSVEFLNYKNFLLEHQLLAIKHLQIKELESVFKVKEYAEKLKRFEECIIHGAEKSPLLDVVDKDSRFIHQSYAEFMVAKFLLSYIENYENVIFGADSKADLLDEHPMTRIFFFAMLEDQYKTKEIWNASLKIIENHYKKNARIIERACEVHGLKTIKYLLGIKCDSKVVNRLLSVASQNNCYSICEYLIENHQVTIDFEIKRLTPLQIAAERGHLDIVKLLIEKSGNVNAQNKRGQTPLHYAARNNHSEIAKCLIHHSANINSKNFKGSMPLHIAAQNGHMEIVKILIEQSKNIDAKNNERWTPLHLASQNGHLEVVQILIDNSVEINANGNYDRTPIHFASQNGHINIIKLLIDHCANINAKDIYDWTPLHLAAQNGHFEVIKILITKGVDINAKGNDDRIPLHLAAQNGYEDVVKLLIDHSANIAAKDRDGLTPLEYAHQFDHKHIVKILTEAQEKFDYGKEQRVTESQPKTGMEIKQKQNHNNFNRYIAEWCSIQGMLLLLSCTVLSAFLLEIIVKFSLITREVMQ